LRNGEVIEVQNIKTERKTKKEKKIPNLKNYEKNIKFEK